MTRSFSCYLKQKMVERLSGTNAPSAAELARQTGITQQNLSRWLQEARSFPFSSPRRAILARTVEQKAQIIARSSELNGDLLAAYLDGEGVKMAELKRWRSALDEAGEDTVGVTKRIRGLERELARRDRALAEAASLLMLGERLESGFQDGDAAGETEAVDESSNQQHASYRRSTGSSTTVLP